MVTLLVQKRNSMVNDMPDVVKEVKYAERDVCLPEKLKNTRSTSWQLDVRSPYKLGCTERENEEDLVP